LPGVQGATLARRLPLTLSGIAFANVVIDGHTPARGEEMRFNYETVGPHYFETMRIPLVHGRDVDGRDHEGSQRVVVINETMAQRFWPGGEALGRRLKVANDWLEIVGVAKDVKNRSLSEPPQPFFYLPLLQDYRSNMIVVARTAVEPEQMVHAVQSEVAALDPQIPVFQPTTLEEHIGVSLFQQRMAAMLLSAFGLLALSLATVGLYGVMAHTVSQRTRELGVRVAIGATHGNILKLILGQALFLSAIGIAAGSIVALILTRFLVHLLYGVGPADPVTFAIIPLLLFAVTFAAGYIPARRAIKIDPIMALRAE
ncbi:MAG: ABC transporter permease, partial [Phycisphaerales bacterium]|nr:ABC transporter permease [Phycisphaerales bacterium]